MKLYVIIVLLVFQSAWLVEGEQTRLRIEGDDSTIDYEKKINLNSTTQEESINIEYFNIIGNFSIIIDLDAQPNTIVNVSTQLWGDGHQIAYDDNVTISEPMKPANDFLFTFKGSGLLNISYWGSFGCIDCIDVQYWIFRHISGDPTTLIFSFHGENIKNYEKGILDFIPLYIPIFVFVFIRIFRKKPA